MMHELNFNQIDYLKNNPNQIHTKYQNKPIISLLSSTPDYPCAPEIGDAISRFVSKRNFSAAPSEGFDFFKESIANFYFNKRGVLVNPDYVLATDSATQGIFLTCKSILNNGDEAIVLNPSDHLFRYSVNSNGGKAVDFPVPINPIEKINWDHLENLITPKTKMICLSNPLNPIGKVFTREELTKIGHLAVKYDLVILADEVWSDIVYSPNCFVSLASISSEIRERVILSNGFSKSYGLSGLRVGTLIAPNFQIYQSILAHSNLHASLNGCNVLAQVAVCEALNNCNYWLETFVGQLNNMRKFCLNEINQIPGFQCHNPQGTFLAFPNISQTGYAADELQKILLENANVAVAIGSNNWFGSRATEHIRLNFACSENILKEALYEIKKVLIK